MQDEPPTNSTESGDIKRELYFPTLIYYQDMSGVQELNSAIKSHLHELRSVDPDGIVRSNVKRVGAWHSPDDLHKREEYRLLTNRILGSAQRIYDDLGYDPEYQAAYANMWAIIHPKYGYNRNHTHPNSLWSGVYYVQVPPDSGRIWFTDPRAQSMVSIPRYVSDQPRQPESWSEVYYEPVEGRMILFPAWLVHEVEPNMSEADGQAGDRIAISFNLLQVRRKVS